MRAKVHKLQVENNIDFDLIGISSHENDYRLTWNINSALNFNFVRRDDLIIMEKNQEQHLAFSFFTYVDEETLILYNLLSNRCDNGFLLEEFKNIDFIIQVFGEYPDNYVPLLLEELKQAKLIKLAFKIDMERLKTKSKKRLLF